MNIYIANPHLDGVPGRTDSDHSPGRETEFTVVHNLSHNLILGCVFFCLVTVYCHELLHRTDCKT